MEQDQTNARTRAKIEHRFWKKGLEKILPGYRESDFTDKLVNFITEIDLGNITEDEKRLIFSNRL